MVLLYQVHNAVTGFSLFTANSLPLLQLSSLPSLFSRPLYQSFSLFQFLSGSSATTFSCFAMVLFLHVIDPLCSRLINQMMCFFCSSLPATPLFPFICPWCAYSVSHIHVLYYVQHLHCHTCPHTVTHTLIAHTNQNAARSCSSFCLGLKNAHTSRLTAIPSHTPTHTLKTLIKMLYELHYFLKANVLRAGCQSQDTLCQDLSLKDLVVVFLCLDFSIHLLVNTSFLL